MNGARGRRTVRLLTPLPLIAAALVLATPGVGHSQLNESCVVSVLNRNVQVNNDGTWVLPNVPANFGRVRARATCVRNGVTTSGESDYFTIPANGSVNVPPIVLGQTTAIPTSLTITATGNTLTAAGATVQLRVTGTYTSGPPADLTAASTGTAYNVSNADIATVSADGLVTAVRSGRVLVQATNEGTQGLISIQVAFSGGTDSDGDGIPDDAEIALGLNPNDPTDALLDLDHDGLTNRAEYQLGTDIRAADTDGDGLGDGEEIAGTPPTNPLLADTDGDGITDRTEIQTGTDPTNPASYDLRRALTRIDVSPTAFTLIVNSLTGIATVQLTVTGHVIDGRTIDLTSTGRGTNYLSSDLGICNFGSPDGRVYASSAGTCTITVANNGFTALAQGTVTNFTPAPVSFVSIPGFANGVAVSGDYAYVAAGASGLQIVGLGADRASPAIVSSLGLAGNANAVTIEGNVAYVAAGSAGMHVVDITDPLAPTLMGSVSTGGTAIGVKVNGTTAFVATGSGSQIAVVNAANPGAMILVSTVPIGGTVWNLDLDPNRHLLAAAAGTAGVYLVDVSNPAAPMVEGHVSTGDARSVAMVGNVAIVADHSSSMRSIDIADPTAPALLSTTPQNLGGLLNDVVVSGDFALGADVYFVNGVPIVDIGDPASLQPRSILSFPARDDNGMALAVDGAFVYLVTEHSSLDRGGSSGDSRLYVGQFRPRVDLGGVAPTAAITSPMTGDVEYEGAALTVTVDANDDVAVAAVQFLVDGQVAFTSTSTPYRYTFTIPTGTNSLTLGAKAIDLGGNVGTAADVMVGVVPDPLTLVTGQIVDGTSTSGSDAPALAGAMVTAPGGRTGVTGPDGRFDIPGVPTVGGDIFITASYNAPDGSLLTGTSRSVPPVRGGVTDVGTTALIAAQFEPDYGTFLTSCDDCYFLRTLPFTFSFFGVDYTSTYVGSNGYLTFAFGDTTYVESLPAFTTTPRISAFFDDLFGARSGGAVYVNDQLPGRFIVTHDRVGHYIYGGMNTLQIQLYDSGRIVFAYDGITALTSGTITGITPGPGAPFQQVDFSTNRNFDVAAGTSLYEYFTSANMFDLDHGFVIFTPNEAGGYNVRTVLPGGTAASSLVTGGPTGARTALVGGGGFANADVVVRSSSDTAYVGMTNTDEQGRFSLNGVPPGGIAVTIRRKGQTIARGAGVFAGGRLGEAQVLDVPVAPPAHHAKKVRRQKRR